MQICGGKDNFLTGNGDGGERAVYLGRERERGRERSIQRIVPPSMKGGVGGGERMDGCVFA